MRSSASPAASHTTQANGVLQAQPILERSFVLIRSVAILLMCLLTLYFAVVPLLGIAPQQGLLDARLVTLGVVLCNLVLAYVWNRWPLSRHGFAWVLIDVVQAVGWTVLAGGSSFFFLFLLPAMVAGSITLPWRAMAGLVLTFVVLRLLMALPDWLAGQTTIVSLLAQPMVVALLFGGTMLTMLNEQVRQEQAARRGAALAAARTAALNEVASRLNDSGLDATRALEVVLAGAQSFLDTHWSMALSQEGDGVWQVAASTTATHAVGTRLAVPDMPWHDGELVLLGLGSPLPLPPWIGSEVVNQAISAALSAPTDEVRGRLLLGRTATAPWSDDEKLFARSLAREAGLALRNARLYAREQAQVRALERFEAARSTFFSTVAHELKTPLTVLKTLALSQIDPRQLSSDTLAEISDATDQNITRIETLINDLLEFTRLEAEAITLRPQALDLAQHAGRLVRGMRPLVERRSRRLALHLPAPLPLVWAEGRRVDQVLLNLVNNAARWTPADSCVEVQITPGDAVVVVAVCDRGPGVPAAEQERIWEKFYTRADDQALSGLGLGLYICRQLVELHGGRIWREDRDGGGSCFCFTLPLARETASDG